ncbi:MAG TPA: DEAD/DEAH box helicase [Chloroflexaceae bacterium]|nr:DEAD/DEAH box helicase [Chloroflexaceae bacterium]
MTLAPGQTIDRRYKILRVLGQGGFGAVYLAEDLEGRRQCAVKESLHTDPDAEEQFALEVAMLRQVRTPNMPRVYDFFPAAAGAGQILVMEYIAGESLQDRIATRGPLPELEALAIALHILTALIHLHQQQPAIIHRDIKPLNIKVDDLGNAWLLDLGIGKRLGSPTARGALAATEAYSPPEQLQRQATDERSDLFALGATLYHLVTGQPPVSALARLAGIASIPAARARPGLSQACAAIIDRALKLDPADRFAGALEMYRAVERIIDPSADRRAQEAKDFREALGKDRTAALRSSHELPPRPAVTRAPDPLLPAPLAAAAAPKLGQRSGAPVRLYSHQAESLERARKGRNLVVVTGTASGKTFCYNLPVLERCIEDQRAGALYLFPIKALINDQFKTLEELTQGILAHGGPAISLGRLHGDLSQQERQALRRSPPRIALSNPDFVHWMLARHPDWRAFFTRLKFIVLDEVHTYRGVFGSNVAMLLRRLLRICTHYGAEPQFICCSATIANPEEFVGRLTGQGNLELVDRDGAARPRRYVHFWEPVLPDTTERRAMGMDAMDLTLKAVQAGKQVITFTRARQEAEQLLARTKDSRALRAQQAGQFAAYRGGYTREVRERIEQGLRDRRIRGVYATNALEMGIDIGGLEVSILTGFPGSRMSFWQQAGRAGRQREDAHVVLIGAPNPLDSHFLNNPADLLYGQAEEALLDTKNIYINEGHLRCMAREWPIQEAEARTLPPETRQVFEKLIDQGVIAAQAAPAGGQEYVYTRSDLPHSRVSIRGVGNNSYEILCAGSAEPLGTISPPQLYRETHPNALYYYEGDDYRVDQIDHGRRQVLVHPEPRRINPKTRQSEGRRFTRARLDLRWAPEREEASRPIGGRAARCRYGEVVVEEAVTEYAEFYLHNMQKVNGGAQRFDPPLTSDPLRTRGLWLEIEADVQEAIFSLPVTDLHDDRADPLQAALHGVEHLLVSLIPSVALCDRRDLGSLFLGHFGGQQSLAHILIYDLVPGGIGLAQRAYQSVELLLARAHQLVAHCPCAEGCPACLQLGWCHRDNHGLSKAATIALLKRLVGA